MAWVALWQHVTWALEDKEKLHKGSCQVLHQIKGIVCVQERMGHMESMFQEHRWSCLAALQGMRAGAGSRQQGLLDRAVPEGRQPELVFRVVMPVDATSETDNTPHSLLHQHLPPHSHQAFSLSLSLFLKTIIFTCE